jgi:filamentous hemagglutinin family protein
MGNKRNANKARTYLKKCLRGIKTIVFKITFKSLIVFINAFMMSFVVFANPEGGQVTNGNASIQQTPDTTVITQTTDKAIIDWHSFNIAPNEATHFQQPSSSSITLNRINPGQGASQIFGQLTANGRIVLINQAGIFFASGAHIDVGSIIVSTSDITNANFLAGKYIFDQPSIYGGSIINRGTIIAAQNGVVALIGTNVSNEGIIRANLGRVALASGNKFIINLSGDQLVNFVIIDEAATQNGVHPVDGSKLENAVTNSGAIIANGGVILLTAKSASRVLDNAINMQGIAVANSVGLHKGVIILSGDKNAVIVSGKIIAAGKNQGESGGTVKILGSQVALVDNARIDVSGKEGGGEVLIGGNAYGAGPELNANYTYFGSNVVVNANALTRGDGGKVIVWSDLGTGFYGNIYAQGGMLEGNGGLVETSGKAYLDVMGSVDASASVGLAGQWLLDPFNVTITTTTTNGAFDNGNPNTYTPTGNTATVNAATINASLNGGTNVTITTGSSGTQAGTITLSSAILKSIGASIATLTLNAASTITINNTISATSGGLNVTLIGDAITLNSAITTNGGNFLSTAQNATTLTNIINTASGTVTIHVNQDGAGANSFAMNVGSSITTTNTSASAVAIHVNTGVGGTGTAALRSINTGSGGTLSVSTNSTSGGDITMPAGTLNVGTGTVILATSQLAGRGIGTLALNMQIIANNLNATTGNTGIFATNTGTTGFNLNTINTTGGLTLTSTASTGITNSGTLIIPGTITIAAGTGQDINLSTLTNNFGTSIITSGRNVTLVDTNAIILGASTISGTLNVTAGGTISESGILTVSGTPTFTVSTPLSDILLSTAANVFNATPVFTNNNNIRDLSLRRTLVNATVPLIPSGLRNLTLVFDNAGIVLPTLTLTGILSATASGAITQTGPLVITGITTLAAGSGNNITLDNINNNFSTATISSGNNVLLQDLNALILGISIINGTLDITTNGALTQSGAGGISVAGTTTLAAGTSNNITLSTATNNFNSVGITSGNNVSLRDANSLILATSNVNGTFGVTTAGLMSQSGPLTIAGITTLNAGATNDIAFNNVNNNFSRVGVTSGNNVTLVDTNALILGASTISGIYNVTAGGTISQAGILNIADISTFTLTTPLTDILLSTSANLFNATPVFVDNGNIRDLGLSNSSALATIPLLPSNLRNLILTFANAAMILPSATLTGSFTGQALGAMTMSGNFVTGANSAVTVSSAGTFIVADGATFMTNNTNLTITAGDINLNTTGALNLGVGTLTAIPNSPNGSTIGLGNTPGAITISGLELQNITAGIFNLRAPADGQIIVDGISAANSANINTMSFFANSGQISSMIFQNNPSSFKSVTASIDNGITIGSGASLTTTVGNMVLNGDAGGVGGANNSITLNDNLTSAGTMTLSAIINGIIVNAPVTLFASSITINHAVNGANHLIVTSNTGTTTFLSPVGATTPLASLTVTDATDTLINQNINTSGNISITSGGNITLNTGNLTSSAGNVLLEGRDITLNSIINANAPGNSIVIAGQTFTNNAGAFALNAGAGNFLVWSENPANDNRGGLAYNFKQYNATYGSTSIAGIGNGFLYTLAPIIIPSLIGTITKPYDGTTTATLAGNNYAFSGVVDSDTVTLNNPVNGIYNSPNVGTNINVSVSGISIASATDGSATVYGYQIIPTANADIGQITPVSPAPPAPISPTNKSLIVDVISSSQIHKIENNSEPSIIIINHSLARTTIENANIGELKSNNISVNVFSNSEHEFLTRVVSNPYVAAAQSILFGLMPLYNNQIELSKITDKENFFTSQSFLRQEIFFLFILIIISITFLTWLLNTLIQIELLNKKILTTAHEHC